MNEFEFELYKQKADVVIERPELTDEEIIARTKVGQEVAIRRQGQIALYARTDARLRKNQFQALKHIASVNW